MQELGANSVRVYHVEPQLNHDGCMSAFASAGIYAWIDLDTVDTYILPDLAGSNTGVGETKLKPRWNETMHQRYSQAMDAFANYDNTAGFFVGNEMLTKGEDSASAPYIKAAARDMKVS